MQNIEHTNNDNVNLVWDSHFERYSIEQKYVSGVAVGKTSIGFEAPGSSLRYNQAGGALYKTLEQCMQNPASKQVRCYGSA
jgi:hypothetical protein